MTGLISICSIPDMSVRRSAFGYNRRDSSRFLNPPVTSYPKFRVVFLREDAVPPTIDATPSLVYRALVGDDRCAAFSYQCNSF